jgi:hypothetical protein
MGLYFCVDLIDVNLVVSIDHFGTFRFVVLADLFISLELVVIMNLSLDHALHLKLIVLSSNHTPEGLGIVIVIEAADSLRVEAGAAIIVV